MAAKGVPAEISGDATAGFVFYQTKEGFQFRSIDSLISQKPDQIPTYTYTNVNESGKTRDNDFAILNYKTEKNQNLIEKLRLGSYASYRMFYNPLTFEFTDPQKGTFTTDDYVSGVKILDNNFSYQKFQMILI